ncbi:hypothetical protein J1614_010746 [Plenodomus biglobosus]|nr:hypothetical protein J1614_010746 [Plenodomus biglobosus]
MNQWPTTLDGFQLETESFYFEMERAAAEIIGCLEEGLGCSPGTLNGLITHESNASELRFNHYPPVSASLLRGGQVSRIWPHFDLGVITLLFTSSVGGLEVEDRNAPAGQAFIPVTPDTTGELIVNISETLQRWTDDQLLAGLHRVSIPQSLDNKIDDAPATEVPRRYSIAYLCKADRQSPAGTLPFFQVDERPRYPNITASEYHRLRLLDAY